MRPFIELPVAFIENNEWTTEEEIVNSCFAVDKISAFYPADKNRSTIVVEGLYYEIAHNYKHIKKLLHTENHD